MTHPHKRPANSANPLDVKEKPLLLKLFADLAKIKTSKHLAHCCFEVESNKQIPSKNSWNPTMSREVCGVRSFRKTKIILQLVDPGPFGLGASPPISQLPMFAIVSIMKSYVCEWRLISRDSGGETKTVTTQPLVHQSRHIRCKLPRVFQAHERPWFNPMRLKKRFDPPIPAVKNFMPWFQPNPTSWSPNKRT